MLIELDHHDIERTVLAAARVAMKAIRLKLKDTGPETTDQARFTQHWRGAKAELAVSIHTGLPWHAEEQDWTHDVGDLEVRSVDWYKRLELRCTWKDEHKHDPAQKFVLARVDGRFVELLGWSTLGLVVARGERREWGHGLCWYMNAAQLHPIDTLLL